MNLNSPHFVKTPRFQHWRFVFAALPVVVALVLTLTAQIILPAEGVAAAVMVCMVAFVLIDQMAGQLTTGLWAGYLNFTLLVAWLSLGPVPALWLLVLCVLICTGIRFYTHRSSMTAYARIDLALSRLALNGTALVVAMVLYGLFNGVYPLQALPLSSAPALSAALLGATLATHVLCVLFTHHNFTQRLFLEHLEKKRLFQEALLMLVVPALPVILFNSGVFPFGVIMGLVVAQAIRYRDVSQAQESLIRHIRDLSTVSNIGQTVSVTVGAQEVLHSIYREINQIIDISTFVLGVYDYHQDVLEYKLVVENGQEVVWPARGLNEDIQISAYVIRNNRLLHVRKSESERLRELDIDPARMDALAYLCIPLVVAQKTIGIMGFTNKKREDAFGPKEIEVLQTIANQIALAVRNAILYDRTIEMAQNLALINQAVQEVMFNLDSAEALRAACETAARVTKTDKAAIFLLDNDKRSVARLAHAVGLDESYKQAVAVVRYDAKLYENGRRIINNIKRTEDTSFQQLAEKGGFQACAEVPLRSGSAISGYLVVYHNEPHFYHDTELEMLETLGYQVTAALDNAELLKALELYASEQAQLVYLSRISTSTRDLTTIIADISEILRQMINVNQINIGFLVPGKDRVVFVPGDVNAVEFSMNLSALPLGNIHEMEVLQPDYISAQRVYQPNDSALSAELSDFMRQSEAKMLLVMPMIAENQLFGVILFSHPEVRHFNDNEWRLIEMATNQVTMQLHNAQQFTVVEKALTRRLNQLSLIERIAQQISSALDRDELINNVLESARQATQADMAALALLTEDDKFRIIGQELIDGEWYEYSATQPKEQGIIGYVALSGQSQRLSAPANEARETEGVYLSSLAVPLKKDQQVIGVLSVESVRPDFFTEEQESFLHNLAGHAVISIENARLLEEREYQIETLTKLRQLSLQLSNALEKKDVTEAVLRTAVIILQGKGAALYDYDSEQNTLKILSSLMLENGSYTNTPLRVPDSVLKQVVETGGMQIIENIRENADYLDYPLAEEVNYASLLVVPIKRGAQVQELLCISFGKQRHFQERDLSTIELLAIQIAAHVENAWLLEKIRTANYRMRAILDATRDGVLMLDRDGFLRDANLSASRMLGIDLADKIGVNFPIMLMEQTHSGTGNVLVDMARILRLEPERITQREFELKAKGVSLHIEEVATPVIDINGNIIGRLLVFRDITEEKSLTEYRNEITHMVVHDLKGPLASIITSLDFGLILLKTDEFKDNPIIDMLMTSLEVSLDSANSLLHLVESILDIAKLERDELPLKQVPASLKNMAQEAYKRLSNSINEANIQVEIDIPDNFALVNVDVDTVTRVLTNLLDNAVKYTKRRVQISAAPSRQRDRVIVRVSDDGRGIPEEERDKVFEKYRQISDNAPARGRKGTGLGLTFCKLVAEAHNGRIWVEAEGPLPGACIALTLPIAPDTSSDSAAAAPTIASHS